MPPPTLAVATHLPVRCLMGHSTGFQFGNGLAGVDGAGGGDVSFGNASNVNPMLAGDPEDHFTRIGLEDSLFKKVERRYRDTSVKWASADAASPSRALSSVPLSSAPMATVPNGVPK